jgi:hypothetical protein
MKHIPPVVHWGIYLPMEIAFLRGVVRETLATCNASSSKPEAEAIARAVLDDYRRGVMDRDDLLTTARASAMLQPSLGKPTGSVPARSADRHSAQLRRPPSTRPMAGTTVTSSTDGRSALLKQ